MRVVPVLFLAALLVLAPVASATPVTTGCDLAPHGTISSVGTCAVTAAVTHYLFIKVTAAYGATGTVHIDAVNSAAGGDRIEFDCYLLTVAATCTRLVETGGYFAGSWTMTGRMVNANPFWIAYQDAWGHMDVTSE